MRQKVGKMIHRLNFKKIKVSLGIREKLLLPIVATLIVVIIGLSITLVTVQQRLNRTMREGIQQTLQAANQSIGNDLNNLKGDLADSLAEMSAASSAELTRSTTKALNKQKARIEYDWEAMMMESGDSIALLLARVAPSAIISKNFQALNSYIKATLQNPNIVYAFYFRDDGGLLTRLIDRDNKKIKTYLQAEGKNRYNRILNGAKNDNSVMTVNKTIKFEDEVIGSVEICIDKAGVQEKIAEMSQRFSELVTDNQSLVTSVLQAEASKVQDTSGATVERIIEKNRTAAADTEGGLLQASTAMAHQTRQVNIIGGIICVALVATVLFIIVQHVIKPLKQTLFMVKDIAEGEGDLTKRLNVASTDEVGELSKWFNIFLDKLEGIIGEIAGTAGALGSSSDALTGLSGNLSEADGMSS